MENHDHQRYEETRHIKEEKRPFNKKKKKPAIQAAIHLGNNHARCYLTFADHTRIIVSM